MNDLYKIEGAIHNPGGRQWLKYTNHFPEFQEKLVQFKNQVIQEVEKKEGKSYIHFGDGDYYFLKKIPIGSARPGKRALSISYNKLNTKPFLQGWMKADYHSVEYLEGNIQNKFDEFSCRPVPPIPTEYLYGLTMNKWFFKTFKGKIGLIGAAPKIDLIKELMKYPKYQEYLGLEKFNDYIKIPQKFACDNLQDTINMVKEQLEKADPDTRVYLYGIGHVKLGVAHLLPKMKKAVYLDVGGGLDGIAGILDPDRPYAKGWINHRLKNYDYSQLDLLNYNQSRDKNIVFL
jgi:hypothetical protein